MKHYYTKHIQCYLNSYSSIFRSIIIFNILMFLLILPQVSMAQQSSLLDKKINLQLNNVSITEALSSLEREANCTCSYQNNEIDDNKKISINQKQVSVKEVLISIFGNTSRFQVSGNQIFIQFGPGRGTIKGTVKTSDAAPAEYVTVSIQGAASTHVDKAGNFVLKNVPVGKHKITATFVGLIPQSSEVLVEKNKTVSLSFILKEDNETLQEVVINSAKKTKGYAAQLSSVGSKFPVPLKDIPNSVSVITRQLMDDQNMNTLTDALNQTIGITAVPYGDGTSYFQSRGYASDIQYDGLPANNGVQYLSQFDLAMYDRVEILRGASGLLQGSSTAAGVVNLARKRPLEEFGIAGAVFAGSWNNFRGNLDLSTPFDKNKKLKGRFVLSGNDQDYFYDKAHSKSGLGYAILEYQPDSKNTLTLSGSIQRDKLSPFDYGVGIYENDSFVNAPRSSFFGTDWSRSVTNLKEVYLEGVHKFNSNWQAKITLDYRNMSTNGNYGYVNGPVALNNIGEYAVQSQDFSVNWAGVDANVTGVFNLFGRAQQFAAGVNYAYREQNSKSSYKGYSGIDIFNINIPEENIPFTYGAKSNVIQYGLYAQTRIQVLAPLTVVLGGRLSNYRNKNKALLPTEKEWEKDPNVNGQFTPYAGLVYALNKEISWYGSYSNVFAAQTQLTVSGSALTPQKGNQFESGVKGSFFNGLLNASAAAFLIKDQNRAIQDLSNPTFYVANGEVRSRGIEAEVSGAPAKGLNVIAGYTYLETKYITDPTNQGDIFDAEEPKHTLKLWGNYTFQEGLAKDFRLGFGIRAVTKADRGAAVQKGYAVANAQIGYAFNKQWSANLTVNNLFDKKYYARIPSRYYGIYGDPRNAMLTIRKGF